MRWLDGITDSMTWVWVSSRHWWWTGSLACCNSWSCKETWLSDWTELNWWPPSVDTKPTLNLSCSAHSFHISSQMYSLHKNHTRQCVWVSSAGSWLWDFFCSLHVALECDMSLHSGTFRLSVASLWWQWKYEMKLLLLSCSQAITLFSILCELLKL